MTLISRVCYDCRLYGLRLLHESGILVNPSNDPVGHTGKLVVYSTPYLAMCVVASVGWKI